MRAEQYTSPLDDHLVSLQHPYGMAAAALEAALDTLMAETSLPPEEAAEVLSARASSIWAEAQISPARLDAVRAALSLADTRHLRCGARIAVHSSRAPIEGPDWSSEWPVASDGKIWCLVEQPADDDGRVRKMETMEVRMPLTLILRPWLARGASPIRTIYSLPETGSRAIVAQTLPTDGHGGPPVLQVMDYILPLLEEVAPGITDFAGSAGAPPAGRGGMTPRELDVLDLLARGYPNKMVARILGMSVRTVETHRLNFRRKIGAGRLYELVAAASGLRVGPGYPPRCTLPLLGQGRTDV